jgi:NAD(P) transhydrogenase subunit alpha
MTFPVIMAFYVFVLACVAGYQLISKVPGTLHTPLMSGANAISGVTILGAITITQYTDSFLVWFIGAIGVALATINVVGGFAVTDRMLGMFRKKK